LIEYHLYIKIKELASN